MSYPFESVAGRRVCCGRCRHQVNQERLTDGVFDSETGLTFACLDCHAVYAACRRCGWYMADGETCANDHPAPTLVVTTAVAPKPRLKAVTAVLSRQI